MTAFQVFEPVIMLNGHMVQIGEGARIDSFVKIEGGEGVRIGRYVHVASFAHIGIGGGKVTIGDFAAVASGAKVLSGSNQMEGESMSASAPRDMQVVKRAETVIGEGAFLGVNAVVMPGVRVGARAVVGAGAVVTKDVPDGQVWAGVPARRIGVRG